MSDLLLKHAADVAGPAARKRVDKEKAAEWIRVRVQTYRCVRFTLSHDTDKGLLCITEGSIPKKTPDEALPKLIADVVADFDYVSGEAAEDCPKPQRFYIGGCLSEDPLKPPTYQWPFMVHPSPEAIEKYGQSDAGGETNVAAVVGALQRQNDKLVTLLSANLQHEKTELREEKRDLLRQQEFLMSLRVLERSQLESSLDNKALREVTAEEKRWQMEVWKNLANAVLGYGKTIGDAIVVGKYGAQGSADPLARFATKVDPGKLLAFMAELSPEEREEFRPLGKLLLDRMPDEKKQILGQLFAAQAAAEGAPVALPGHGPSGSTNGATS